MKIWRTYWMGLLAGVSLTPTLWAQIPAAPAIPAAAAPLGAAGVAGAAPAGAPAAPSNIWSFFCMTPAQKAACKQSFCNCALGQMINSMMAPAAALSGGMIGNCCPLDAPNPADLAAPSDSPAGAAAKIKADEANAKARRAAVRYLGTVDCHYWPEAQLALINALRADRNECVRLEAAWSLGRGCCCTKRTIVALSITVAGSDRDGNPAEDSDRVKAAAAASLSHCLACLADVVPVTLEPVPAQKGPPIRETPREGPEKVPVTPATYYEQVQQLPLKDVAGVARRVMAKAKVPPQPGMNPEVAHSGAFNIVANAIALNGTHPGKAANAGSLGTPQAVAEGPNGPASTEVVTTDASRGGLIAMLARRFAPTPLNEDETEDTQFKTPPLFPRKSQDEQVVMTAPPPPEKVVTLTDKGQPVPAPAAKNATVPVVTTVPAPVLLKPVTLVTPPKAALTPPSPSAATTPYLALPQSSSVAPKPSSSPVVQTTYAPPSPTASKPSSSPVVQTTYSLPSPNVSKPSSSPVVQTTYSLPSPTASKPSSSPVVQTTYSLPSPNVSQITTAYAPPRNVVASPANHGNGPTPTEFPKYIRDLITTLERGTSCEESLAAAFSLANSNWKTSPEVVQTLARAALHNPMVPVRVTSIRCLVALHVNTPNVRTTLQALKSDPNATIRAEAEQALNAVVFYTPPGEGRVIR